MNERGGELEKSEGGAEVGFPQHDVVTAVAVREVGDHVAYRLDVRDVVEVSEEFAA